ncbi:hypothetical protein [Flexivirga oryzae]|uniref:Uncharacterized protein n=1 Tax=Flexivirga oryzae TaxID=1794944 RepID=A0A839MXD1_9MICO|nr:hypothetical protein [Flexivirga oryzae]MBB2890110.1 hypothetical protein [Flexivirga oryzae]
MTAPAFGAFLVEAGALLTVMLLARRYALQHVPQCYLPRWVRVREQRREHLCRLATTPALAATLLGVMLILIA